MKKADAYQRSGRYSPGLVASDVAAMQALYRANGFDQAKITTEVKDTDEKKGTPKKKNGADLRRLQHRRGAAEEVWDGECGRVSVPSRLEDVKSLMNTQEGQPFSLVTLSGDRDAVLAYYLSHGFDQAKVDLQLHKTRRSQPAPMSHLRSPKGQQVFVNRVLLSGLEFTRPKVAESQILVHPGDPLGPDGDARDPAQSLQPRAVQRSE